MKKTFQKTLIAASVGAVLAAASVAAHAGTPATTNLLFPYITTKAGAFTFISISNQYGTATPAATSTAPLHFTYATKTVGSDVNAVCDHTDGDGRTTPNDLMQFEVQNKISLPTMFGDTTSSPKYFTEGAAGANREGFLVVNNANGSRYGTSAAYANLRLYGEARIIDTTTGLYFGYSTDDLHTMAMFDQDATPLFSDPSGPDSGTTKVLSWFPTSIVNTSVYVVPLSSEWNMAYTGNVRTHVKLVGGDTIRNGVLEASTFGGHYNNNELFQSHETPRGVTCFGSITRDQLVGSLNNAWSANGGWGNLTSVGHATAGTIPSMNAVIYKQESTTAVNGQTQSFMTRVTTK